MAEFTPITTQEQLDKVIGERIAGVKAKYEGFDGYKKKAEDYDALKAKSDGFEQQIAALNKEINGDGEKNLGYKKQLKDAETMAKFLRKKDVPPLAGGDPQKIDDKKTAMKGMLASLKGE